jgi:hypothetical protein
MNREIVAFLSIAVLGVWTSPSSADDWDKYQETIGKHHYFIDDQRISQLECVVVTAPSSVLAEMRSKLSDLYVFEGSNDLTLRYTRDAGFSTQEPSVVVTVKSTEDVANAQRLEALIPRLTGAIAKQFAGWKRIVMNIVGGYVRPKRENYQDVKVTDLGDRSIVTFKVDSRRTTEEYRADSMTATIDSPEELRQVEVELKPIGNRTVESKIRSRSKMKGVASNTDIEMAIEYQMLAGFPFPAAIALRTVESANSTQRTDDIAIRFERCIAQ